MSQSSLVEKHRNLMYHENRKSLNWFVGCRHNCVYCKPSFQAQMKRQLHNCKSCYLFEPHAHLERLQKAPPKTNDGEFIFFPSSGDPTFASKEQWKEAIQFAKKYWNRTLLIQSKDPACFILHDFPKLNPCYPENVILGTTMETDTSYFSGTPSKFESYSQISEAPEPYWRYVAMIKVVHCRKEVTIEPILQFGKLFARMIREINPEFVYVGYDNHNCRLPEPSLADTKALIKQLETFTEVRLKTIRPAWWEKLKES